MEQTEVQEISFQMILFLLGKCITEEREKIKLFRVLFS